MRDADLNEREFLICRIGFLKGMIAATTSYAIWRNGKQTVGVMERDLHTVIEPYNDEIVRLEHKLRCEPTATS